MDVHDTSNSCTALMEICFGTMGDWMQADVIGDPDAGTAHHLENMLELETAPFQESERQLLDGIWQSMAYDMRQLKPPTEWHC